MTSEKATKRAVIYTRISVDRDGTSVSPDRQQALCRQLAQAREWEVVKTFEDRAKSGWQTGVKRPEWERLLAAVKRHEVDVVMAYSLSRFGRRTRDLLELSDLLQTHGVALVSYSENIDTSTAAGRMFFTILAALAEMEAEQTSERVASAHKIAADRGDMPYSGSRCFGYQGRGRSKVDDVRVAREADAVRTITAQILAGGSLASQVRWLNDQGITTTAGNLFTSSQLSQTLRSPRLAGLRKHGDQVLPGNWEGLISEADWLRLVAELDSRRNKGTGRNVPAHLLTGLAVCGRCKQKLRAASFKQKNGQMFDRYQCLPREGLPNCGRMAASKKSVDAIVIEKYFHWMSRAELRPVDSGEQTLAEIETEIAEIESKLSKAANDHYVLGRMDDDVFVSVHDQLSARLRDLRSAQSVLEAERADLSTVIVPGDRASLERWWYSPERTLAEQRDALAKAIKVITVQPAAHRGGNVFDKDRVKVEFRFGVYVAAEIADPTVLDENDPEQVAQWEADQELSTVEIA